MPDIADFRTTTVEELAAQVAGGACSAADLTEAALARISDHDGELNSFVAVDAAGARAQAAALDERLAKGDDIGPLAGIPIGVKDLEDAAGFQTVRGAMHLKDSPVVAADSVEVGRLRAAGCVVIGKTNTPEFGWIGDTFNPVFGTTRNPWNLQRSPGGSSGGTSAALAGGLVPLATGSDGGGSIRIPSALTALSGLKPAQGRIPAGPTPLGAADLATLGPMARRIRDVALALDVVVGPDPSDLRSLPAVEGSFRRVCDDPRPPRRLLWCPSVEGSPVDDEIREVVEAAVDQMRDEGVEVIESGPVFEQQRGRSFLALFFGSMLPGYAEVIGTDAYDEVTPGLRAMLDSARPLVNVNSVEDARKVAQAMSIELAAAMEGFDALITPTTVGQTPRCGEEGTVNGEPTPMWIAATPSFNMTRRPAGTTCAGFVSDHMPVGLQVVGHQLADLRTIELTAWAEDLLGLDPIAPFPV